MTIALAAVAAVLFLVAVILAWAFRRNGSALRTARQRTEDLTGRLAEALERLEGSEQEKRAVDARAAAAEGRLRAAEQKSADAERRAGEAERRVGEEMRRAAEARRAAAESEAAGAVWELERLRVEREWLDVVGPGVPLPVPWDGTIAAVVATELSVIREVIGTPSDLTVEEGARPSSPAVAALTARVSVEMLRTLARSGEEMQVAVTGQALTVVQPVTPGDRPPDLTALVAVANEAGLALDVQAQDSRSVARLSLA
ncbi:MAG TPA: hypothetical protein VFH58_03380 [Acidimicrobiales bacterium]|nr:hypothetical protein [Acidimicrobiales bacterium]